MGGIDRKRSRRVQTLQTSHWLTGWKALGRLLAAVFGAWILAVTFAGCGGQPANGKVHIQLSTWGSAQEVGVLKKLLQKFEAAHPRIQVDLLHIPDNYYQKLQLLIAGDLTPDVMLTNSISFPIYASQGIFMDLQPLLSEQISEKTGRDHASVSEFSEFYPQALQAFTWQTQSGKKSWEPCPEIFPMW
jgi:ABC-type glycerol-3-phosphate transport system substrate-binding protein